MDVVGYFKLSFMVDVGNLGTNLGVTYAFVLYNDKGQDFFV
jgi:hypothetical protein